MCGNPRTPACPRVERDRNEGPLAVHSKFAIATAASSSAVQHAHEARQRLADVEWQELEQRPDLSLHLRPPEPGPARVGRGCLPRRFGVHPRLRLQPSRRADRRYRPFRRRQPLHQRHHRGTPLRVQPAGPTHTRRGYGLAARPGRRPRRAGGPDDFGLREHDRPTPGRHDARAARQRLRNRRRGKLELRPRRAAHRARCEVGRRGPRSGDPLSL